MISESEMDLAYLVWGSVFTKYLLYHNLIPSNSISSILLAYKQHLQDEGGETDLLPSAIFMADSSLKEQVLVIIVPVGLPRASELQQCRPGHGSWRQLDVPSGLGNFALECVMSV
jgi:hypothetical protein